MSNDQDVAEKLKELAKLTVLTNRISSIHEKNLKNFPFVAFNGLQSVQIDYDFSRNNVTPDEKDLYKAIGESAKVTSASFIKYSLKVDPNADHSHLDNRCKAVETWVRQLLWKDITVEIHVNDALTYKSNKNE